MDWSHGIFASDRLVRFEEMEYSVPREHAVAAVRAARAALERHAVSFPIELRFTAGDDALLSPAHGRDSAFVAVHVFKGMPYEPAFREVEAALGELGGRPHWGKRSFLDHTQLAPRYPRWDGLPAHPRTSSTRAGASPTPGSATCWDERMKTHNIFAPSFEYDDSRPRRLPRGHGPLRAEDRGQPKIGCSIYELPPGQALCPYHYESDEEWIIVLEGRPSVRHPNGTDVLKAGDAAAFPVGPEGAHKVFNASDR